MDINSKFAGELYHGEFYSKIKLKMKKTEIYVPINNRKEAKQAKTVLKAFGEITSDMEFSENVAKNGGLYFNPTKISQRWCFAHSFQGYPLQKITLKQLIELLVSDSNDHAKGNDTPAKIAVRVENEKEFKALMKYYDSLGWKSVAGRTPTEVLYCQSEPYIRFEDGFGHSLNYAVDAGYKIIPFSDFAIEHNIKLPILTSEDGVDLYEGDICSVISFRKMEFIRNDYEVTDKIYHWLENYKYFSTKQAALDWIEAQKPKHIELSITETVKAYITSEEVRFKIFGKAYQPAVFKFKQIRDLYKAMEGLNNG